MNITTTMTIETTATPKLNRMALVRNSGSYILTSIKRNNALAAQDFLEFTCLEIHDQASHVRLGHRSNVWSGNYRVKAKFQISGEGRGAEYPRGGCATGQHQRQKTWNRHCLPIFQHNFAPLLRHPEI